MSSPICRIDRLKYSDMEELNAMDKEQFSAMIFRQVKQAVEDVFGEKVPAKLEDIEEVALSTDIADKLKALSVAFGGKVSQESEFVPQHYEMDPETEDVLHNGTLIVDGMKVLIENPSYRVNVAGTMNSNELVDGRMKNRWCTVTESKLVKGKHDDPMLEFIGVYDDGIKRKWEISGHYAWIVKKDSLPRIDHVIDEFGYECFTGPTVKIVKILKASPNDEPYRYYTIKLGDDSGTIMPADEYVRKFEARVAMAETGVTPERRETVLSIIRDINRADQVGSTNFDGEFLDSEEITQRICSIFNPKE